MNSFLFVLLTLFKFKNILGDSCSTEYKWIGNCYTKIKVCYGFYDWEWQYQGQASANGTVGPETKHYDSSTGAGEHAVYELFQLLPTSTNSCNCGDGNTQVGKCNIHIKECFRFNTTNDVSNSKPDYLAWANPISDPSIQGYYCCNYNQNTTAQYAIQDLQKKDPSCFY